MKVSFVSKSIKALKILLHRGDYVNYIKNGVTYYPECVRKNKSQILKDQLYFVWKYGYVEKFYYAYGFDRVEMTREKMEEYIVPFTSFMLRVDYLNSNNPYYDDFMGKMTCRVINQDKFYFYLFLSRCGVPTPKVFCFVKDRKILYVDEGFKVDRSKPIRSQLAEFLSNDMDVFAKPSDGMMGQGVFRLCVKNSIPFVDGVKHKIDDLIDMLLSADYIIEETIIQDKKMAALCSTSVNTIRLQTVMDKEGNVIPIGAMVRIGREGSSVDNWAKGGVIVGIKDDGKLKEVGFLKPKYGTTIKEHPDNHLVFKDYEIPFYHEAVNKAVELHSIMYRSHSIGWDIAITKDGPVFIEGNDRWEISMVQTVHGGLGYLKKYF